MQVQIVHKTQEGSEQTLLVCSLNTLWKRPENGCLCLVLMAKQEAYNVCSISVSFGAAKLVLMQLIYNFNWLRFWDSELVWQKTSSFYKGRRKFWLGWESRRRRREFLEALTELRSKNQRSRGYFGCYTSRLPAKKKVWGSKEQILLNSLWCDLQKGLVA